MKIKTIELSPTEAGFLIGGFIWIPLSMIGITWLLKAMGALCH